MGSEENVENFCQMVMKQTNLRSFDLEDIQVDDASALKILNACSEFDNLTKITMFKNSSFSNDEEKFDSLV